MAKHRAPSVIEIDALLTGSSADGDEQLWTDLVRAAGSGDAWRRAQRVRARLDSLVELTGRFPWVVQPWLAIRATKRFVTERLPPVRVGGFSAPVTLGLGVLGPDQGPQAPDRSVTLRWGEVVELRLPVGTTVDVRPPSGTTVAPEWRSNKHPQPVPSPAWRLEPGEAPVLVTVEVNGARAGLVILEV